MRLFLFLVLELKSYYSFSQNQGNSWMFGDSAGLNFETSPPSYFFSSIYTYEACASISDNDGNLLFYTNGNKVWNQNNEVMSNGDDLEIAGNPSSVTQGVIILPSPGFDYEYIIIYKDFIGYKYSRVDMNGDGSYGEVIEKNTLLDTINYFTEKMYAIKHANGRDWW